MKTGPVIHLAWRSLLSRRLSAGLTLAAIALSVVLFVGVEKIRQGARSGFERTITGTDLIVGARSSPINLVLYSVFHIGAPTNSMSWATYQAIAARDDVAWTVPLSLGDSHRGYRVIGTTTDIFKYYRYGDDVALGFEAGQPFSGLFDAVLGAAVARDLGYGLDQSLIVGHGLGQTSFAQHDSMPFRVSGILAPTGTPLDRAILVSLEGIEAIHVGWSDGAPTPMVRSISADDVAAMDLEPKAISAFMAGLTSRIKVLGLQRTINTYRGEPLQAVIPGVALSRLWTVVGLVETALAGIGAFVIVVGLVGIITSILSGLNERRREMAILRAVGAGPLDIMALLVGEAALLAAAGSLLGLGLLYGGLWLTGPWLAAETGLPLTTAMPGLFDLWVVLAVTGAAILFGLLPAIQAYRSSLSDGLSPRL